MINTIIYGIGGKMGRTLVDNAPLFPEINLLGGVDKFCADKTVSGKKVYKAPSDLETAPDLIIDFSRPESLGEILSYALKNNVKLVLCSTGYGAEQLAEIDKAAEKLPILRSGNMSLGVNTVLALVEKAAAALSGFDIEIIEKHHNEKVDAPSGTALMIADAANKDGKKRYVYGREGGDSKRGADEIGIHAVRGGTIVGEHEIIFAGADEIVTVSHTALSKRIFAVGAYRAGIALMDKKAGLYSMRDIL